MHPNIGRLPYFMVEMRQATVACPFCSTLNRVDLTKVDKGPKCGNCGRPVTATPPVVACAKCGSALSAEAKFCAVCGQAVADEPTPELVEAVPGSSPDRWEP